MKYLKNTGFSLVESMMVFGLLGAGAAGMIGLLDAQSKGSNRTEFMNLKEQLRTTVIAQFLNFPPNCKCLFEGVNFNKVGITPEIDFTNGVIGRRNFLTPGDCSSATVPLPLISNSTVINGLKATSIKLKDIQEVSGQYLANFVLRIETQKKVSGAKEATLFIPVVLGTAADPDPAKFQVNGCSITAAASGGGSIPKCRLVYEIFEDNDCSGKKSYRHSDWTNEGTVGAIKWTYRDSVVLLTDPNAVGAPVATRNGRNYMSADVSCTRVGIQCL